VAMILPAMTNVQGNGQATNAAPIGVPAMGQVGFIWTTNVDKTITIEGYESTNTKVTVVIIPDRINGLPVTSIGANAFLLCDHPICSILTSVTIPYGVTNIESGAFGYCCSLVKMVIPSSVTSIGNWAFGSCTSLTSVTIPSSVTSIGVGVFNRCTSLTNATIPDSVTSIGERVFADCKSLTTVSFKGNAPNLGREVFDGTTNAIVYYLEGTTGWGPTFGGRPTAVWKPEAGHTRDSP
jgi:hypothetical protein